MKLPSLSFMAILGFGFVSLSGCATTPTPSASQNHAIVCPQCKMVAVTVKSGVYRSGSRHGLYPGDTTTYYKHTCPGCQGAIETFFKEGQLKHKCSICKTSPFTCPIVHPH